MSGSFDPYAAITGQPTPRGPTRRDETRAALGNQAGRAWLRARLAEEVARPSYQPGMTFDQVAHAEGRKAMLRDIARELFDTDPQTQD